MRRHSRSESVGKLEGDLEKDPDKDIFKHSRRKENIIKEYLKDYTANSNLHGLKYIGERERTFVEKVFWLFMFICCVVLCSGLIRKLWIKWNESPVIVSFAENPTPVWEIPYPAVTICFETKALQSSFNYTENYHLYNNNETFAEMSEEESNDWLQALWYIMDDALYLHQTSALGDSMVNCNLIFTAVLTYPSRNLFEDISMVCDDHLAPPTGRKFSSGRETLENIRAVSPNMTTVFFGCKYKDVPKETCADLFNPILTEEGQCYTFNTLGNQDLFRLENLHGEYDYLDNDMNTTGWSLDKGYYGGNTSDSYPHKGLGYGVKAGVTFLLKAKESDLDYLCKGPVQGFKILLHNPAEMPRLTQQYFRSPLSQEVVVAVKPKMMTTSDGLRPYDSNRRKCYFQDERYLRYFKVYTQANCEMECLTNFTEARCGCVHFGVPHGPGIKVCNSGSMACLKKAQMELVGAEANVEPEKGGEDDSLVRAREVAADCRCLPACTSIEYEAETSQADYNWKEIFRAYKIPIESQDEDVMYARVMIFFKEAQFITSRRSELYGQTDFLANCGGLLGLFMGFSILSLVEIIYFLTLRVGSVWWRKQQRKKHASKLFPAEEKDISSPKQKVKQAYVD